MKGIHAKEMQNQRNAEGGKEEEVKSPLPQTAKGGKSHGRSHRLFVKVEHEKKEECAFPLV